MLKKSKNMQNKHSIAYIVGILALALVGFVFLLLAFTPLLGVLTATSACETKKEDLNKSAIIMSKNLSTLKILDNQITEAKPSPISGDCITGSIDHQSAYAEFKTGEVYIKVADEIKKNLASQGYRYEDKASQVIHEVDRFYRTSLPTEFITIQYFESENKKVDILDPQTKIHSIKSTYSYDY